MQSHYKKKRSPINSKTAMNQIWSILGVSMGLSFDLVHNNANLVRHFKRSYTTHSIEEHRLRQSSIWS